MPCDLSSPLDCKPSDVIGDVIGDATSSAWESICKSFADAAVSLLKSFAEGFAAFPNVDLSSNGVRSVYGISLGIAVSVAALLMLIQIARTVITHDGNAFAQAFIGLGKAGLAFLLTLTAASTALVAADGLTAFIIESSFGSSQGLTQKLTGLFELSTSAPSLMLLLAVIGIVLVLVLWFEMLLRNAAIAVLIGTSPIAAVGQISELTRQWWSQLVGATVRLIILKPVIALVFAVGFGITGNENKDVGAVLAGMLILLLAGLAWPAIGRFFTFAAAHSGGPSGLAALVGYGAGRAASAGSALPGGVSPEQFGRHAEARTMSSFASRSASGAGTAAGDLPAGAGTAASAGAGVAAGTGVAAVSGPAGVMAMALVKGAQMAQQAANSMVGRMEQTAGHAGLDGASSFARPAGAVTTAPLSWDTVAGTTPGARAPETPGPTPPPTGGGSAGGGEPPLRPAPVPPVEPTSTSGPGSPAAEPPPPYETSPATSDTPPVPPSAEPVAVDAEATATPAPEPAPAAVAEPAAAEPAPAPPVQTPATAAPPQPPQQPAPVVPQPRTASPVEHVKPAPSSPVVEHVKPAPSAPIEHTRPTSTSRSDREKGSTP